MQATKIDDKITNSKKVWSQKDSKHYSAKKQSSETILEITTVDIISTLQEQ
jgi:hypothetical protein